MENKEALKEELIKRLKRIEGQVKGLQKMVDAEQGCESIMTQIAAARAALHAVGMRIFETHSYECLNKSVANNEQELVEELVKILTRFTK